MAPFGPCVPLSSLAHLAHLTACNRHVSHLAPGQTALAYAALELGGSRSPVRFHLSTDRGSFAVELRPPQGALLSPAPLGIDAFEALRVRLSGMHESSAVLPAAAFEASAGGGSAASRKALPLLAATAQQHMACALVGTSWPPLRLSAATTHDKKPVLAIIEPRDDGGVRIAVHAEDAIGGNILLDELRAALVAGPV